jgi:hypothetical protein
MGRKGVHGGGGKQERRSGFRELQPVVVVACEGKTEKAVLDGLRSHLRLSTVTIEVRGQCGNTLSVVDAALDMRAQALKKLGKAHKARGDLQTWAVFDRDEHPDIRWVQAFDKARAQHPAVATAHSNPCIELWAILLYRDQTAHIERGAAQKELATLMAGYDHEKAPFFNTSACLEPVPPDGKQRWQLAGIRARALASRHAADGEALPNPSTDFDLLVELLFAIASKP